MQFPTCCHIMTLCHEDKQILYFQCNHGTCVAVGMKCKYCNVIKFSKKGCIKNIKYIMLKHYKQEHLLSAYNTGAAVKGVQLMIECNSTISTKSHLNSESNEPSTIVSSVTSVESSANTYQYVLFNHFDCPPNQMFFLNMFHPFLGGACGILRCALTCTGSFSTNISTLDATQVFSKPIISFSRPHQNMVSI